MPRESDENIERRDNEEKLREHINKVQTAKGNEFYL